MPKDNIDRAIKKGIGELEGVTYDELFYEAYTPGGGAMLIEVLTDNKNRAAAEIRNIVTRSGANLGTVGSVSYLFKRKGVLTYDGEKYTEDQIMEAALDAGADDVVNEDGSIVVYTDSASFENVLNTMNGKGFETLGAEISMVPDTYISVDLETAQKSRSSSISSRRMKTSRTFITTSKCPNSKSDSCNVRPLFRRRDRR